MLKRLLSLVLLLSLSLQLSFSEYVLTDAAYAKLLELQKTSEILTEEDRKTILELTWKLESSNLTIKRLEKKQKISEEITALDQILIEKQEESLKAQNIDSFIGGLEIFFWGLVVGLFGGLVIGLNVPS